jgi:hypothetical protein
VCERQSGEVIHRIALAALGPVPDAARPVTVVQHMNDLQVAVDEHRCPWPQRRLRDLRIAPDNVGGHDIVGDEQPTLRIELWRTLDYAATAASGLLLTLAARATAAAERRAACGRRHAPQHPGRGIRLPGVVLDRDNPRLAN